MIELTWYDKAGNILSIQGLNTSAANDANWDTISGTVYPADYFEVPILGASVQLTVTLPDYQDESRLSSHDGWRYLGAYGTFLPQDKLYATTTSINTDNTPLGVSYGFYNNDDYFGLTQIELNETFTTDGDYDEVTPFLTGIPITINNVPTWQLVYCLYFELGDNTGNDTLNISIDDVVVATIQNPGYYSIGSGYLTGSFTFPFNATVSFDYSSDNVEQSCTFAGNIYALQTTLGSKR